MPPCAARRMYPCEKISSARCFELYGMSTSILVKKMKEAAAAAGKDYEIAAYSASEAATKAADADAVLLGPQIRFSKDKIAAELPGVPVEAIDMRMYGRMDGKGTVELAEKIMKG